jgi:hypothetical protein
LVINAENYALAREAAFKELGEHFATMYPNEEKYTKSFPDGPLHTITVG